ncbi:MAG: nucleoside triphosphate pyrophosphohydrolase [Pseudomonadota bacterium]
MTDKPAGAEIARLLNIMEQLRNPDGGCPWDLEQNFRTIAPYTVEEAYEVADAIERNDMTSLKDELGDLLFQTVFHAQMAREEGLFNFDDVAAAISDKMERRHPHVFSDAAFRTADEQTDAWEEQKATERDAKGETSLLADVPFGLPGLTRAVKLQKRAARVGFDWTDADDVLAKITEETKELADAVEEGDPDEIEDEFGDLLFVLANLSRHLKVDPEAALRRANEKFTRRFQHIEKSLNKARRDISKTDLQDMEALWNEAKSLERKDS